MKKIIVASALAALACGCITVNKNDGGNSCLKPAVVKDKVHIKYELGKDRVNATDQIFCLFGWISWGSTATHIADHGECSPGLFPSPQVKAKNGAYANACEAANCDSIAAARYTVTTDDYFVFKKVKAEVSGYPAKAVGVELIDAAKCPLPCDKKPACCKAK